MSERQCALCMENPHRLRQAEQMLKLGATVETVAKQLRVKAKIVRKHVSERHGERAS